MGQDRSGISGETVTSISGRLADLPDLRLPGQLTRNGEVGVAKRREYVAALLQRDPGVFLERHGEHLSANELMHFESLRSDHEVDFYLKALGDARGDSKSSALIRNRRLAHMQRLMAEGQYFSESAMEQRQPWLYHQYIGQYRPSADASDQASTGVSPGLAYADRLLDHAREATLAEAREEEQLAYDAATEEEDGEDGHEEVDEDGRDQQSPAPVEPLSEREGALLDLMQQSFLAGHDPGIDYPAIDGDAELDEHWARLQAQDAEDRYFSD
ncbi:hypothetical protein ACKKBG_A03430 [Auxenochlorella protothecoides x Auxenochlorella symbiontica]|uniref:CCD97-like C-terminal domain-containing protein n=1 Tax=Auxenochlorella protothecoides TaxID=3075 RepID=A0A1D1ZSS9_AUXPR